MTESYQIIQGILRLNWVVEIITQIVKGQTHYNQIISQVPYLSHTELNRKLKVLMDKKIITRSADRSYALTQYGQELYQIMKNMSKLGKKIATTADPKI